jgi:CHAT domain-containing protein/Tfp pilus assembly protein PilF
MWDAPKAMARHTHRWVLLLLWGVWAASFLGCGRQPQPSPEALYESAHTEFEHGDLLAAQREAQAYQQYEQTKPEWAGRLRVLQAEVLLWRGMNQNAIVLLNPELPASLSSDEAAVRRKIIQGLACCSLEQFPQAEQYLAEAEKLASARQPKLLGEVALSRGTLLFRNNDLASAEHEFQRALKIAREEHQEFLEAKALGSLGLVDMKRQHYGEAIDWFQASLTLSQSIDARALTSKTQGNLGWCYHNMGDLDAALELFMQAEGLSAQLGLQKDRLKRLINIGNVRYDQRDFRNAESYYQRALIMAETLDDGPDWAICLYNLAVVSFETGQLDDAERYNREALELKRASNDPMSELHYLYNEARIATGRGNLEQAKALLQQVINGSGGDFSLRWIAQAKLANIYATLKQPIPAEMQFRRSLATIDQARSFLNRDEYRLTFVSSVIRFYDDYVTFLVGQGKINEALHVVELNRARTLSEGLQLKQGGDSFVSANFNPEQTARHTGTVVLSYWLAPEHSYLWAVTASRIEMYVLPPESEIEQTVHSYRSALAGPRDVRETQNASGQRLYEMLVAPAEKLIPSNSRVIIIPSGSLYELNFETLLVPGNQLHYWIEDVIVTNASSLLLLEKAAFKRPVDEKNILLIGDAVSPNPEYMALPQAASEIDQVKKYFPAEKAQVYQRQTATAKAYVEGNPGGFSFIHFVAHGVASRESPLDSAVILSGDENSYKLYAREIIKIPLHANLVTISSCQGAAGRTYAGEGLVGLSWAFLRAGAHQVIAALWEVNDASTPQFMDHFYAGISAGGDPAVALRAAKLAMLHSDSVYRRPFYWAPFQLYKGL